MRTVERRRFKLQMALGALLTVTVVLADRADLLLAFEQVLYDLRCRYCQLFLKPPVPPVHLDIDAKAIEELGRLPWPRTTLANIVQELYAADAKAIAIDMLFSEPSDPAGDAELAKALASAPKTVIAVQLDTRHDAGVKIAADLEAVLFRDLALEPGAARAELERVNPSYASWKGNFEGLYFAARKDAMTRRINEQLDAGQVDPSKVFALLLPSVDLNTVSDTSPLVRLFERQWDQALRVREVRRFLRPKVDQGPETYAGRNRTPPILPLLRSAAIAGFTNYDPDPGGKVRAIPLWIAVDGKLLPQLGLAAVCAAVGAKPQDVRLSVDSITIPRARPEADLEIPVHTHDFGLHKGIAYCINVPTFGKQEWESMYDFPRHEKPSGHHTALAAHRVHVTRDRIARNESVADEALINAMTIVEPEDAENYVALSPSLRPRLEMIRQTLPKIDERLQEYADIPSLPKELEPARNSLRAARTALQGFPQLDQTLRQLRDDQARELKALVQGRMVFIGFAAEGQDLVTTSLHQRCPGVVVHGAIGNAIMSGELWSTINPLYTAAITIILGFLTTISIARLSPARGLTVSAIGVLCYAAINGFLFFDYGNLIVGAAGPITAVVVVWAALTLTRVIGEIRERNRITKRFQSYVDPSLVRYVIDHPDLVRLEGEVREMTIAFTDLAGFTTLAEHLGAPAVKILSMYKGKMVPIIRSRRGLINCFMGDGIMFSYGAPEANANHAVDAVKTIFAMHAALDEFNQALAADGHAPLGMRAGVSTGHVVVGDSGSEDGCDYTAIGDTTNLGARLESANKAVGTRTLISERTVELLGGAFLVRPIGRLVVAGKRLWVMTYEPIAATDAATNEQKKLAAMTTEMFDHYVAGRFAECIAAAQRQDAMFGLSKLTALYRETSQQHLTEPPVDFDGQIQLKEK